MTDRIESGSFPGSEAGKNRKEKFCDTPEGGVVIGEPGKVISARGTEDGLVLRIDGGAEWREIVRDLEIFLGGRRKFFEGGEVAIEWLERLPVYQTGGDMIREVTFARSTFAPLPAGT